MKKLALLFLSLTIVVFTGCNSIEGECCVAEINTTASPILINKQITDDKNITRIIQTGDWTFIIGDKNETKTYIWNVVRYDYLCVEGVRKWEIVDKYESTDDPLTIDTNTKFVTIELIEQTNSGDIIIDNLVIDYRQEEE